MAAYVIVDIDVTDPAGYEEYKKLAPASITAYGGKYLLRGGKVEIVEGNWPTKRFVMLEFENATRAKEWLDSPEYAPARQLRRQTANTNMIIVENP